MCDSWCDSLASLSERSSSHRGDSETVDSYHTHSAYGVQDCLCGCKLWSTANSETLQTYTPPKVSDASKDIVETSNTCYGSGLEQTKLYKFQEDNNIRGLKVLTLRDRFFLKQILIFLAYGFSFKLMVAPWDALLLKKKPAVYKWTLS